MTCPPRMNRSFGSTSDIMIKANELEYNTQMYVDFMSKYTGGPSSLWLRCLLISRCSDCIPPGQQHAA